MLKPLLAAVTAAALLAWPAQDQARAQQAPKRAITQVAGDLYRFQNNFHYSVFYVTSEGIIVTDPINADAAAWLRDEIGRRFDQPLRYLVYSHDHADHIAGGQVFAEAGAVVIAHENARRTIIDERRPTAVPQITYKRAMNLELGGKQVQLRYVGRNHSDNSTVMLFPAERALFAVDFVFLNSVPYRDLPSSFLPDWIGSLKRVRQMDAEIVVPGHGAVGRMADLDVTINYMQLLYDQVMAQARLGKSLAETKAAVDLSKYKHLGNFDNWSGLNVEGAYKRIQLQRRGN